MRVTKNVNGPAIFTDWVFAYEFYIGPLLPLSGKRAIRQINETTETLNIIKR